MWWDLSYSTDTPVKVLNFYPSKNFKYQSTFIFVKLCFVAVVWPVKTRTRIFLPFFDWYGGEGSGSHRRIIIQETQQKIQDATGLLNNKNKDSLLGYGRFSRVIRCKIREESRFSSCSAAALESEDITDCAKEQQFSQELAVKVS